MLRVVLLCMALSFMSWHTNADLITVDADKYTFSFTQSTASFKVWTAPATKRIRDTTTTVPSATGNTLSISCAREELESFQIIIAPTSIASMTVSFANFPGLGSGSWLDVGVAQFSPVSTWAQGTWKVTDYTTQINSGASVTLSSTVPTVLWITVYVPGSTCGKTTYTTTFTLTPQGQSAISIPVSLYVFDVVLDRTPHMDTYGQSQPLFNTTGAPTLYNLTHLDKMKEVYLQHRLTSRSPAWPAGFSWDAATDTLVDATSPPSTTACIWANGCVSQRYGMGKGGVWRGVTYGDWIENGFSSFEAIKTDNGRPSSLGGITCDTASTSWITYYNGRMNGWMCTEAYETEWAKYLVAARDWMVAQGWNADPEHPAKGFWYTQNEPQNWPDYTISAYLCTQARTRAPGLKIMLSREAHPFIFNRADSLSCGYDIWMAHIDRFPPAITWDRQANHGEQSWIYFLDRDANCRVPGECAPILAPFVSAVRGCNCYDAIATNDGMHYRAISWVLWSMRATGWGYYLDNIIWDNSKMNYNGGWAPARPRVSASLLREGLEDYEYLYRANCNRRPEAHQQSPADITALSIGYSIASWRNDETAVHGLRHELGRYLEGSRPDLPYLVTPKLYPFGDYNIDFTSDPGTNTPYTDASGQTWIPVDMNQNFAVDKGFGWQSQYIGVTQNGATPILRCQNTGTGDAASTICYDDYNHPNWFYFSLEPGDYSVTVAVGWPGRTRDSDIEYVEINNVIFRNYTCATVKGTCVGSREYTRTITVRSHGPGGALVMTVGSPYQNEYTIFSYLKIRGIDSVPINRASTCAPPAAPACSGGPPPVACVTQPTIANGSPGNCAANSASGFTCTPICNTGFAGTLSATCNSGSWSVTGSCATTACGSLPSIPNGAVGDCAANSASGTVCTPVCNSGFAGTLSGRCNSGVWSITGVCVGQPCPGLPILENTSAGDCAPDSPSGVTCTPVCNANFAGTLSATCTTGSWIVTGVCADTRGPPCTSLPTLADATLGDCTSGVPSGTSCTPVCSTGFTGTLLATCSSGSWIVAGLCTSTACTVLPPLTNADPGDCRPNAASGSTCTPVCSTGFSGTVTATCNTGVWSVVGSCSSTPCAGLPSIQNAGPGDCVSDSVSGTTCTPVCNTGFNGNLEARCVAGEWTSSGVCSDATCGDFPSLPNLSPGTCTAGDSEGTTCTPVCNSGFRGSPSAVCDDGVWEISGVCVGDVVTCSAPVLPESGDLELGNCLDVDLAEDGDSCSLACQNGFDSENLEIFCKNGVWTSPPENACEAEEEETGPSAGVIVGAVIGALVAVAILIALGVYCHHAHSPRMERV